VSDHARGIQTVLEKGKPGEIYNIGTGDHLSNNDLATEMIMLMGLNETVKSYVTDRQGHDFRYSVNSTKIESLGFKRMVDFNFGLIETINWYGANPGWWNTQSEIV
jgi:dTDP-glucose 4,6-dehydratase